MQQWRSYQDFPIPLGPAQTSPPHGSELTGNLKTRDTAEMQIRSEAAWRGQRE